MNWRFYLKAIGYSALFSSWALFSLDFIAAWFDPSKSITIFINKHGEANIEIVYLLISLFPSFLLLKKMFVDIVSEGGKKGYEKRRDRKNN